MKRTISLIAALMLLVCGVLPACASGAIETTDQTWYVVSHSDDYRVYYFATVSNTGDKPVSVNDLLFEIQDPSDVTIESTSKYKLYPEVLEAGQTGWLAISKDVKDIDSKEEIDHYNLTITSKVNDDRAARPLTASAEYLEEDEDENENVLRATVTNDGTESVFDIIVASAAFDADGKLLYVTGDAAKNIGLAAGNSFMQRSLIQSDITDALEDAQQEIASAQAVAYTMEDLDD